MKPTQPVGTYRGKVKNALSHPYTDADSYVNISIKFYTSTFLS